ncbi:MAG: hypothetical protein JXO49_09635 [Deltaproteobacteria bacterium]|nr:hypothetical protein [Candidatus Anaeroferrophillus wilburensis]MBN2889593.1 hypothetical protein [Deltaproteobacteria bacterium]
MAEPPLEITEQSGDHLAARRYFVFSGQPEAVMGYTLGEKILDKLTIELVADNRQLHAEEIEEYNGSSRFVIVKKATS